MGVRASLLKWYDKNRRELPWRAAPGEQPDPYRVWLSEIMLQQTTVATVRGYFPRFLRRWPSLQHLARANLDEVLLEWQGLGYYSRARNLLACARKLVEEFGGIFPEDNLRALPGIGPYTAAAIGAIAFNQPVLAIDANAERVIARLFRIAKKEALHDAAAPLVPKKRPGDFAQALMDLGAMVCQSGVPKCELCPLKSDCQAFQKGDPTSFPVKAKKKKRQRLYAYAYWLEDEDKAVAFQRRRDEGLLAGLMEVPMSKWEAAPKSLQKAKEAAPVKAEWRKLSGTIRHIFTHIELEVVILKAKVEVRSKAYQWHRPPFRDMALSSLIRKVIKAAGR